MTTSREDIWEWPDRFSARIPPGWQMRSQEPIEIVPSEGGGAAHITFLRRERSSSPNRGEAIGLVRALERGRGGGDPLEEWEGDVLVARHSFLEQAAEGEFVWEIMTRVWTTGAVVCTYVHEGSYEARSEKHFQFSIQSSQSRA